MKRNSSDPEEILDRAVREVRSMSASAGEEDEILGRVQSVLTAARRENAPRATANAVEKAYLTGCDDFVSLIPDYLSGRLAPSRTLLLQDHLMECAVCWKVFEAGHAKSKGGMAQRAARPARPKQASRLWKIGAVAACLLIAAMVATRPSVIRNFMWPIDVSASVEAADGKVYGVQLAALRPLQPGQRVRSESVRTEPASSAVLEMADGSRIEMNERTELKLYRFQDGVVINLDRGNIIVAAAKQHGGHLYVKTADARVTVVGTMFAVTAGVKGSRVSVMEGQVQVDYARTSQPVAAGQQVSTSESLPRIGIPDEISWSRNLNKYMAILQKSNLLNQAAAQTLQIAGLRYQSSLIPLVPADSVLIASFPNVDGSLAQSYDMMKARISENTILDQWWLVHGASVDAMILVASRYSKYLGPEIVIALPLSDSLSPVVLANANSPEPLAADLRNDPSVAGGQVVAAVNGGLMVISNSRAQIQRTLAYQAQFGTNPFQSFPLYQRLAQAYTEGVGWLLAADLEKIVALDPSLAGDLSNSGLEGMKQLVVEQKPVSNGPAFFQTLGFKDVRGGIASWLAAPAAFGALDFVSPNAYTAAGVVTKDPNLILDDIFTMLNKLDGGRGIAEVQKFQQQNNVNIRRDIAGSLGTEFLVALEPPILPAPSWKAVMEVTDPGRLQSALMLSFNELNRQAALENKPAWTVTTDSSNGWTSYKAVQDGIPGEIDYAFLGGYLVIAPRRQLVLDAARWWMFGTSLGKSAEFRQQMPSDGRTDFSGFIYHNIKSLADSVPGGVLSGINVKFPTLVCFYGYPDRVVLSSKGVLGTDIVSAEGLGVLSAAIGRR